MTTETACAALDWSHIEELDPLYVARSLPVRIRGARAAHDLGIFGWSGSTLGERLGDLEVPIIESPTPFLSYERDVRSMPFASFIDQVFDAGAREGRYLYFKNPTDLLPSDLDDSRRLRELSHHLDRTLMQNLWISGTGITVGMHFDPAENLNIQIRGRKRFTLHPPAVAPLYPLPMFSQVGHISAIYRHGPDPDLSRFPRFDPGATFEVVLEEGDILYLPPYWWHQVESLGRENINLNFWWLPTWQKQLAHPNQALRGYIGLLIRRLKFGSIERAERTGAR